jgi:hypothetical protein
MQLHNIVAWRPEKRLLNPKAPRLSILHISPRRVSCFLPQVHPNPICIFYVIPPGVVNCVPYSGSAGWGGELV